MEQTPGKISLLGRYEGYGEKKYPSRAIHSLYLEGAKGIRLATDLVFPAYEDGTLPEEPLPVLLVATRGGRFDPEKGNGDAIASKLIPYGYIVAVTELHGCGASFGTCDSFSDQQEREDVQAVIEWLADQKWCSGSVGMVGVSNRSFIQLAAATQKPKGLKAITPTVAVPDFYYQNYPNGVSSLPILPAQKMSDAPLSKENFLKKVRPVDEDPEGDLAYQAYLEDQYGKNQFFVRTLLHPNMNRDTPNEYFAGEPTNLTIPPLTREQDLIDSGVRQHQFIGQLESGTLAQLAQYRAMGGSLILGPWTHTQSRLGNPHVPEGMFDFPAEYRRWMDAALKGMDNGFDQAPPVAYYMFNAPEGQNWRYSDTWPLENEKRMTLYLSPEKSGTVASVNDGTLSQVRPKEDFWTEYQVNTDIQVFPDPETGKATYNRMDLCWDGDMTASVDQKGLTFTSMPLFPAYQNQMAGCVSVELWVTSTAPDGDFLCYLEEVRSDGTSHYLKDGVIRASHRTASPNPDWEVQGAVWHGSMTEDVDRCLAEGMSDPVCLRFAVDPIVWQFSRGSRIRVTITCADLSSHQHPMYDPENLPVVKLYQGGEHASFISIPFLEHEENVYHGNVTTTDYDGPGTLYFFQNHTYLYYDGIWKKMVSDSPETGYYVKDYDAVFPNAGFTFRMEGNPVKNGIIRNYTGGDKTLQPLAAVRHRLVGTVPIDIDANFLFVPGEKTLKLDVFQKNPEEKKVPCVIHIHGYGGSYSVFNSQLKDLYDDGFAVAGIDLRNYPCNPFPDYIYDVKGAIRSLRAHAEEYGIDPERIGCYGVSLGGNSTLMAAITAENPELEGDVGGNLDYSSRLQAAAAGYAWSELLYMGKDIIEEYEGEPEMQKRKADRTDGENAPLADVIHYSGPGKGVGVLRRYLEDALEGTDPEKDEKLAAARKVSPVNYVAPDCPPICIFGGYGMRMVDIPMKQSLRTFKKLHEKDVLSFLYANTMGLYGRREDIRHAILHFFQNFLRENKAPKKLVVRYDPGVMIENARPREEGKYVLREDSRIYLDAEYLDAIFGTEMAANVGDGYLELSGGMKIPGVVVTDYPEDRMFVLREEEPPICF